MKIKELKVSGKTKRFFAGSLLLLCAFLACKSSSATTDGDGLASLLSDKSYAQIPLGNFLMGLPDNMPGVKLEERERPQHRVLISQAFEMGKHEVTQLQWEAVMGSNPSAFKGRELPVMNISWNDVQDFLKALQAHDNRHTYRLPTEAEWEYIALERATSQGPDARTCAPFGPAGRNCRRLQVDPGGEDQSRDVEPGTESWPSAREHARLRRNNAQRDCPECRLSSVGTVATHQHPIQAAMLAVIVVEPGFVQRGTVIDNQQIALLVLVRIAKLRLRDLVGQILQKILGVFG